jgi:hypothetical protein
MKGVEMEEYRVGGRGRGYFGLPSRNRNRLHGISGSVAFSSPVAIRITFTALPITLA